MLRQCLHRTTNSIHVTCSGRRTSGTFTGVMHQQHKSEMLEQRFHILKLEHAYYFPVLMMLPSHTDYSNGILLILSHQQARLHTDHFLLLLQK